VNPVSDGSVKHPIYCLGNDHSKPPVLLLHELPGLSASTLEYAESLSADFTVYVPMLFGNLGESSTLGGSLAYWLNGEWKEDEDGQTRIAVWLQAVTKMIESKQEGKPIGVIGNCLTGTLPLALLNNPNVKAVVLAQPTLPLRMFRFMDADRRSLGIPHADLKGAKEREDVKIYGVRFEHDCVSSPKKQETLQAEFGDRYINAEIKESEYLTPPETDAMGTMLIARSSANGMVIQSAIPRKQDVGKYGSF
jgi:dienelactone hydrolase